MFDPQLIFASQQTCDIRSYTSVHNGGIIYVDYRDTQIIQAPPRFVTKRCKYCGRKQREEDVICYGCGAVQ